MLVQKILLLLEQKSISWRSIRDVAVTGVQTCALPIYGNEYDLYEIKTISDIRLCIRESLSQLLEYGLYHTDIKVRNYYIVGSIVLTDDAQKYLNALRKKYHIPVNYIQVDTENEIHEYKLI